MDRCLPSEQLRRFLDDQLDGRSLADVAAHVDHCSACQRALDELTRRPMPEGRRDQVHDAATGDSGLLERLRTLLPGQPAAGDCPEGTDSRTSPVDGPPALSSLPGRPAIEGFRIIREVGRGGMGVVYEAEEERLSRHVALKVLPGAAMLHPKQVQRFEREARLAARLHHTHIVPVYGSGSHAGHHYYFMQYIDGQGLDSVLRELKRGRDGLDHPSTVAELAPLMDRGRLSSRSLARIGLEVAEALDYAHRQGVLHRDIKPSNLLLDREGTVWVADFGLAKPVEADEVTSTGDVPGTVRYMAPERFAGRCDERSDLYSLGLTLYELAALRPAYETSDGYELLERMRREDPPPLRKLDPRVPRDLETIVHKAMARDPAGRYGRAAELAADLRRFLEQRPIVARRASVAERLVRWCRRNPSAAAFLVALLCGTAGSSWEAVGATRAEATARTERDRAEHSRDRALEAARKLLVMEEGGEEGLLVEEARPYRRALIRAGLHETQELVREMQGEGGSAGNLVSAYHALARIQNESGDRAAAVASARKAVDLAQALWDRSQDAATGRLLGFALSQLGAFLPDVEASREAANRSSAVFQTLLARHDGPDRGNWALQIAVNHYNAGHYLGGGGRLREAVEELLAARAACESAIRESGVAWKVRGHLVKTEGRLCQVLTHAGRRGEAIAAGRRAIATGREMLNDRPDDYGVAMDLANAYQALAESYQFTDETVLAIPELEAERRLLEEFAAKPGQPLSRRVGIQARLAVADLNLWNACDPELVQRAELRRTLMVEAFTICDKLSLVEPLPGELPYIYALASTWTACFREQDSGIPDLDLIRKAEGLWQVILRINPMSQVARGYLVIVRRWLADELAAQGCREEAGRYRRISLDTARGDADLLFEIALECLRFARAGVPLKPALSSSAIGVDTLRRRFDHEAMSLLREAIAAGFHDGARLRDEPLMARLQPMPEFQVMTRDLLFPADPFASP